MRETDRRIKWLGSHLEYIDGAQTRKLPWSIVIALERFIQMLLPEIKIMLRPLWEYNYTIDPTDLRREYLDCLADYEDIVKDPIEDIFKEFSQPCYIVSFPSLERKNILLHCLLGHEIGHLVSREYIKESDFLDRATKRIKEISIQKVHELLRELQYEKDLKKEIPLIVATIEKKEIQNQLERAGNAWRRGVEEILSDIIGALLFGPAVLFSSLEFAIQNEMDHLPSTKNNFYPPWRLRLREVQKIIEENKFFPLPERLFELKIEESIKKQIEIIRRITVITSDLEIINSDPILSIVYSEILQDIESIKFKLKEGAHIKNLLATPETIYKRLPHLINRLDIGVPPNASETSLNEREPVNMVEIINAAWFHKISWEDTIFEGKEFNTKILVKRDTMNRLTLKGIEYSDIEKEYRKKNHISPYKVE